ncbi:hypothetical protein [Methylomonas sp. CM2]|uniref:hypothetical protein n=1 Tax=Methylomonas sp. CM2 TaxID=3417647 RepID=UPI003CF86F5C
MAHKPRKQPRAIGLTHWTPEEHCFVLSLVRIELASFEITPSANAGERAIQIMLTGIEHKLTSTLHAMGVKG